MIAGLGPAGYTLAHYLLNDGHVIVAIDGLKIEPLDPALLPNIPPEPMFICPVDQQYSQVTFPIFLPANAPTIPPASLFI